MSMSVLWVILWQLVFYQLPPSSQYPVTTRKNQDVSWIKTNKVRIQEKNATFSTCSSSGLLFHLVLEDKHVEDHSTEDELGSCQHYQILSISNTIYIKKNMDKVGTFPNSTLKEVFIESKSNDTIWKFFEMCSDDDQDEHLCRITCPSSESWTKCHTVNRSELDKDRVIVTWFTWILEDFLPLIFTVVPTLFLVMFLWWNWIQKTKKTRKEEEVLIV
ncbi:uncharacterized protein LOC135138346 isoform X1 [Zophobas morio]|uniref:uncharacterized protein LOC135138346 isoform X1 n=1 Tax=Zophobas morio TaxID=2755281 RepID=UPI0030838C16